MKRVLFPRALLSSIVSSARVVLLLGCIIAFCSACFSAFLDFDHIPKYVFHITTNGRLLHNPQAFLLISIASAIVSCYVLASRITALSNGRNDLEFELIFIPDHITVLFQYDSISHYT